MAGLYLEDTLQAQYCDEVSNALEDINHHIVRTFWLKGEKLKHSVFTENGITNIGLIRPIALLENLSNAPDLSNVGKEVEDKIIQMVNNAK